MATLTNAAAVWPSTSSSCSSSLSLTFAQSSQTAQTHQRRAFSEAAAAAKKPDSDSKGNGNSENQIQEVTVFLAGTNRKNIVNDLCTKVFTPNEAFIGRSRMSRLGSDFGVMSHVRVPTGKIEALRAALVDQFPGFVTGVSVSNTEPDGSVSGGPGGGLGERGMVIRRIKMIGADDFGLLEQITSYTSSKECNIITLESETVPANHAGYDLFH